VRTATPASRLAAASTSAAVGGLTFSETPMSARLALRAELPQGRSRGRCHPLRTVAGRLDHVIEETLRTRGPGLAERKRAAIGAMIFSALPSGRHGRLRSACSKKDVDGLRKTAHDDGKPHASLDARGPE